MVTVSYPELSDAYGFGGGEEHAAYLSLDTGKFYCISDFMEPEEEMPDDVEASDLYLLLPGKSDLGLGKHLALRFVEEELPTLLPKATETFRHKGAYARYKDLLESQGALERWYQYEADATKKALLGWCAENDVQVTGT